MKPKLLTTLSAALLTVALLGAGCSSSDTATEPTEEELATEAPPEEPTAEEPEVEVATTTTAAPTTTRPPVTTTTEPPLATIGSGTYIIGIDFDPGMYRVAGYFALLDEAMDIVENDGEYGFGTTLVNVPGPGGESVYIEISGEAILAADFPVYVNAVMAELEGGIYIVGTDIAPGRYRVSDDDYAYAARLRSMPNGEWDIISNDGNEGSVIIIIQETDDAFQFSGKLEMID